MSRSRKCLRPATVFAATAAAALLLSSCGGASGDDGGSASASDKPSPSPTASTKSVGEGGVAELRGAKFTAPDGWLVEKKGTGVALNAPTTSDGYPTSIAAMQVTTTLTSDINDLAEQNLNAISGAKKKRLPDVTYGGNKFFHIRDSQKDYTLDHYGTLAGSVQVLINWTCESYVDSAICDANVKQVMSTFECDG